MANALLACRPVIGGILADAANADEYFERSGGVKELLASKYTEDVALRIMTQ